MKTLCALMAIIASLTVSAQDTLRTIYGKVIPVNIKKLSPYEVSQRRANEHYRANPNTYRKLSTSEISEIVYKDGRRDSVLPVAAIGFDTLGRRMTSDELHLLGSNDAKLYYHGYKGAATGTLLATFPGSPMLGLVVATATSLSQPKPYSFTYPNKSLLSSEDYRAGYVQKARRIKASRVWGNWGMGTAVTIAAVAIISGLRGNNQLFQAGLAISVTCREILSAGIICLTFYDG